MFREMVPRWTAALLLLVGAGIPSCVEEDTELRSAADSLIAADPELSMTDDEIIGFLAAVNTAEVESGRLALEKATSGEVKEFARRMVNEHQRMRELGEGLAQRIRLSPREPRGGELTARHEQEMARLQGLSAVAFDSAYVAAQVEMHRAVLDGLRLVQARSAPIQEHLASTVQTVETHLADARELQLTLASAGAAPSQR